MVRRDDQISASLAVSLSNSGGRVRKGNPYVRRLLCEFAHAASRTKSAFHAKFQSLIVRRGHKRAIVALALKMLRTIFFMLKRGDYYRDSAPTMSSYRCSATLLAGSRL
jgi:transposase